MYVEFIDLMYKILESGGNVSDGNLKINADNVPEFMINCALSGI